jgi:MtrB/PioB family decaheme-associated outer membrane protein
MRVGSTARGIGFGAACCVALAGTARADADGELRIGGRTISGDTHSSKFEEYRDLEPGFFGSGNFLLTDPNDVTFLWGNFENVGYDDQRYAIEAGQWGRLRLFGEYSELPHVFSNDARTLYSGAGSRLQLLDDALQASIQAAASNAAKSALLGAALDDALPTRLEYQLRTIRGGLVFDPTEDFQFETGYRSLAREGRKPFAMGFGSPGGTFVNYASPIDERTDEVTADLRFGRGPLNLEFGYLGSFFGNDLNSVTIDNPLRITDSPTAGPIQGRMSQAPDNMMNNFHATGAYELPLAFPARIATTFSYSQREQDDDFLPHTINSALAGNPLLVLPQDSLDGEVDTYLANALLTLRPLPELDLRARYRYYEFSNDTPVIVMPGHVLGDQSFDGEPGRNVPNEYERQQASFDASYRFSRAVTVRGGPFWDQWSRSRDREVSRLDEYGAKLATDLRPARWALVRLDYLLGVREGTTYNPFDYIAASGDPNQIGDDEEFVNTGQLSDLRKFDEADRQRNEVKLLTQFMPHETFDVSVSGGWSLYDYKHSSYGVDEEERWNAGLEFGYTPLEWLSMSAWYNFERVRLFQNSRWRPVTGGVVTDDPINDWNSDSTDIIHTFGVSLDFVLVPDKLDLGFRYLFERGDGQTDSNSVPGFVGGTTDGGNSVNFPDIEDRLQLFSTTLSYHLSESFTVEGTYAFEDLSLSDYRVDGLNPYMPDSPVGGSGIPVVPSESRDIFLGDELGDYQAHIFGLSVIYKF